MYLEWKVYQMECVGGHIVGIFSVAGCSGAPAIKGPGCPNYRVVLFAILLDY